MVNSTKAYFGAVLLLTGTTVYASPPGFHVGVNVGAATYQGRQTITDGDINNASQITTAQGSKTGINGGLSGGLNIVLNRRFEINVQVDGNRYNEAMTPVDMYYMNNNGQTTDHVTTSERVKNSYGVSIRPLIRVNKDSGVFFLVGYRKAKFLSSIREEEIGVKEVSLNDPTNREGFDYGMGLDIALSPRVNMQLEVAKTNYQGKQLFNTNELRAKSKTTVMRAQLGLHWFIGK